MARNGQWQGAEGFKIGDPKRFLGSVPVFNLINSGGGLGVGVLTERLFLRGLTGNLRLEVGAGFSNPDTNGLDGSAPAVFPVNGARIQLYPFTEFNDSSRIYARPVFQDPAGTAGQNTPLPQDLPFYWEGGGTEADGIMIEVTLDASLWGAAHLDGQIVVQVAVEYNGNWWDVAAFTYALSLPTLSGAPQPLQTISTSGGG